MIDSFENKSAIAYCNIGVINSIENTPHVIRGECHGKIVNKRADNGFGWDPIFLPDNSDKTFSEMSTDDKNKISHRGKAVEKFVEFMKKRIVYEIN